MARILLAVVKGTIENLIIPPGEKHVRLPRFNHLLTWDREPEPRSIRHDRIRLSISSPDLESLEEFRGAALFVYDGMGALIDSKPLLVGQSTPTERWALIRRLPKGKTIRLKLV